MQNEKRARGRPKSLFKESTAGTLQSLDRALEILQRLADLERCTLSDLCRSTGVPTATTHRILTTLLNRGFVSFDDIQQEWMIGIETYRTGASYLKRNRVVELARPIMQRLMQDTGETSNLAVPDGDFVVFVSQIETSNPIRAFFPPGSRTQMYASGTGKALLAAMRPEQVEEIIAQSELQAFTKRTLIDPAVLRNDLATIRKRGWSFDEEERHAGMSCIGAAIYNDRNEPFAGVSVSGPSARFTQDSLERLGKLVSQAAEEITLLVGGQGRRL